VSFLTRGNFFRDNIAFLPFQKDFPAKILKELKEISMPFLENKSCLEVFQMQILLLVNTILAVGQDI